MLSCLQLHVYCHVSNEIMVRLCCYLPAISQHRKASAKCLHEKRNIFSRCSGKCMVKGMPVCARMQQMAYPTLTRAFLQADPTATMHCHPEWCTHPPPPVPPFLLAQNLSSKQIAPTDNMWSKTDNTKRCHWLLKG